MYITLHIAYCICWRSFGLNVAVGLPINVVDEEVWLKIILLVDLILSVVEFVLLLVLFNRVVAAFLIGNFCLFEKPIKEYVDGPFLIVVLVGRDGVICGVKSARSWSRLADMESAIKKIITNYFWITLCNSRFIMYL